MTDYAKTIDSVFNRFGIDARVVGSTRGPSVTRYEATVGRGVKMSSLAGLGPEIAYATAAETVRIEAPIPGKSAVGIELPNETRDPVNQCEMPLVGPHPLSFGVGKDIEGNVVAMNLAEAPHLLVAGQTGSGKSSFINSMLVSLLETDPDLVQFCLIDMKRIELGQYNGVAHLWRPVITEVDEAISALKDLCALMDERYEIMEHAHRRTIDGLGFPYLVVVVDELADLLMQSKAVETHLVRLAQKGRAAGLHLVLCTQRPTVDVCTGLLKANCPSRLSFAVGSATDARVILDETGAEQLLGKGDGLFKAAGMREPVRIQGALVTDEEIGKAVKAATATAAVERMVDTLTVNQVQYVDFFDQVIEKAENSYRRAEGYIARLNARKGFFNKGGKMDLFVQAPAELGEAAASLYEVIEAMKFLKSGVVVSTV